jgi:hypothetical protein
MVLFGPITSAMLPEAVPDATAVPFTVILAAAFSAVGVTVTEVIVLCTQAEYEVTSTLKLGDNVPSEISSAERFAL